MLTLAPSGMEDPMDTARKDSDHREFGVRDVVEPVQEEDCAEGQALRTIGAGITTSVSLRTVAGAPRFGEK